MALNKIVWSCDKCATLYRNHFNQDRICLTKGAKKRSKGSERGGRPVRGFATAVTAILCNAAASAEGPLTVTRFLNTLARMMSESPTSDRKERCFITSVQSVQLHSDSTHAYPQRNCSQLLFSENYRTHWNPGMKCA